MSMKTILIPTSKLYVFDVARARASPTPSNGPRAQLIQITSSPGRPLCVRRGSRGLRNQNRPLPHHTSANRREILGPRLTRLGSGGTGSSECSAPTSDPTGGLWGHVQNGNAASCRPVIVAPIG
jgi:hypothetical protein